LRGGTVGKRAQRNVVEKFEVFECGRKRGGGQTTEKDHERSGSGADYAALHLDAAPRRYPEGKIGKTRKQAIPSLMKKEIGEKDWEGQWEKKS